MKDFLFHKRHNFADPIVAVAFGAYCGYEGVLSSYSGDPADPNVLFRFAVFCGAALFIASLVAAVLQSRFERIPSFLPISILGPLFFGIAYRGTIYIEWSKTAPFSMNAIMQGQYALGLALIYA